MDPSFIASIISVPFNVASDIMDLERQGKSDQEIKRAIAEAHGIDIPDESLMKIKPAMIQHQRDIATDPAVRGSQLDALRRLSNIGAAGGMDPQSQQALQEATYASQKQLQDSSAELMRQQMARGTADSGNAMAMNLSNGQASANMLNRAGVHAAGDARQRALQAIAASGSLAGNIRGADFGEAESNRDAWNQIEQFNENAKTAAQQGTANNLLNRTGAQTNKAGAVLNASSAYANNGKDQGKKVRQLGQDLTNPIMVGDKTKLGGK